MDVSLSSIFNNINDKLQHNEASLQQECTQFDVCITKDNVMCFGLVSTTNTLISATLSEGIMMSLCERQV